MSAPAFGTSGAWNSATGTTVSYAVPASVASGDIIVIPMFIDGSTVTLSALPSGFAHAPGSPRTVNAGSPGNHSVNVVWKRASAGDTGTYDFTLSASAYVEGQAHRFTGCIASGNPWDGNTSSTGDGGATSSTTTPAVSFTTTGPGELSFFAGTNWAGGAWTPPTGFTEITDAGSDATADYKIQTTAGSSGTVQATCASSDKTGAWLGALIGTTAAATSAQGSQSTARHPGAGPSNLRFLQSRRSNDYFSAWLTDTGTGVDALTVAASFTIDDPASGTDAITVTAAVPLADTATAVDALTVQDVTVGAATPSPWHPGRGPTAARFYQTPRSTDVSLSTPVFLADTGSAADALTVAATVPLADTAAGDDQFTVAAAVPLTDTASGTDSLSVAAAVPLTDAASGVDAVTVAATVPLTDAATATDTIAVTAAVPLADAAAAVDALTVLDVTVGAAVGTTSRPWHPGRGPTNARFYQAPRSTGRVLVMAGQISGSAIGLGGMEEAGAVSATESASSALSAGIQ